MIEWLQLKSTSAIPLFHFSSSPGGFFTKFESNNTWVGYKVAFMKQDIKFFFPELPLTVQPLTLKNSELNTICKSFLA